MASVRARTDTGMLLIDFRYRGERCREQTLMPDTPANRKRLEKLADRIERAISRGEFLYADFFPDSPRAKSSRDASDSSASQPQASNAEAARSDLPSFGEFAEVWFSESEVRWRKRHKAAMRDTLNRIFLPAFGAKRLDEISRADLLAFRADIAKRPGRGGRSLSNRRINKLMAQLKAILDEAADRYSIESAARSVKPLKQKRADVQPFTIEESNLLIASVRADYQAYLTVRLLTGLRTGEVNGLQWCDIDFAAGEIRVQRTVSRDGDGDTKTEASKRSIPMVTQVRAALQKQRAQTPEGCLWVFHTVNGNPIDAVNFTNRVWYPLLRHLGLKVRPPYQMRHTAATLMLASGENPEWVAQVLGHSTTEMLFRVYSRFVPNLTRNDGRAYAGLLNARQRPSEDEPLKTGHVALIANLSIEEKHALLATLAGHLADTGVKQKH